MSTRELRAPARTGLTGLTPAAELDIFSGGANHVARPISAAQAIQAAAETTEIMARAAWKKSAIQLERALGNTLRQHGITIRGGVPELKR